MDNAMQPEDTPELRALYEGFERNHMNPLWTQTMRPHAATSQTQSGALRLEVGRSVAYGRAIR